MRQAQQFHLPPARQQSAYFGAGEAVVDQVEHALIFGRADHPAGGLYDLLQAGVEVGVVVAIAEQGVHALADFFVDRVELGQAEGGDEGADQAFAGQVHAFAEYTAEHGEADAASADLEALDKALTRRFVHLPGLRPYRDLRVVTAQLL